jgi:hypothetical protein
MHRFGLTLISSLFHFGWWHGHVSRRFDVWAGKKDINYRLAHYEC